MRICFQIDNNTFILPFYRIALRFAAVPSNELLNDTVCKITKGKKPLLIDATDNFKPSSFDSYLFTHVFIYLTDNCNLKCDYCYYCSGGDGKPSLDKKSIKKIVERIFRNAIILRQMRRNYQVQFIISGGGEPTFEWDSLVYTVDLIREYQQRYSINAHIGLSTNATLLTEARVLFLDEKIDNVQVSFDCLEQVQCKQRPMVNGENSYYAALLGLRHLDNVKMNYSIRTVVEREHYPLIPKMIEAIFKQFHNVKGINIVPCDNAGRAYSRGESIANLSEFYDYFIAVEKDSHENKQYVTSSMFNMTPKINYCMSPFAETVYYHANGKVLPCAENIGDGYDFVTQKNRLLLYDEWYEPMKKMCSNCFARYYCGTGCPNKRKRTEDGFFKNEDDLIFCNMQKRYVSYKVTQKLEEYEKTSGKSTEYYTVQV